MSPNDESPGEPDSQNSSGRPDPKGPTGSAGPDRDETPGLDELLGVLLEESTLWPLLIVIFASTGAFGAALLVLAFIDHNPFAAAALLLIAGMTFDLGWRARSRPGLRNVARGLGLFWLASLGLAAAAIGFGIV